MCQPPPVFSSSSFTLLTSLTNNYIHSDHLPPELHIHLSISAPSCLTSTSMLPLFPQTLHFHILEPLANQQHILSPASMLSSSSSSSLSLSPLSYINALFPSLPLFPLLFPVGFCLHFSVNLPENALAVMKAEGRGNPPGFH